MTYYHSSDNDRDRKVLLAQAKSPDGPAQFNSQTPLPSSAEAAASNFQATAIPEQVEEVTQVFSQTPRPSRTELTASGTQETVTPQQFEGVTQVISQPSRPSPTELPASFIKETVPPEQLGEMTEAKPQVPGPSPDIPVTDPPIIHSSWTKPVNGSSVESNFA